MKIENKNVLLTDVLSSEKNPRYTKTPLIEDSFLDFFKVNMKSQNEVLLDLLSYEGNFESFLELIESISIGGFRTHLDSIYCIDFGGKYIVAEGNRRISALKLLTKKLKLPPLNKIDCVDIDEDSSESDVRSASYKKIKRIISQYKNKPNEKIDIMVVNDEAILYDIVYTRHVTGENIGKRQWGRGKYLFDLYANNQEYDLKNNPEKFRTLSIKWSRTLTNLKSDLNHAINIVTLLKQTNIIKEEEVMDFLSKNKISSLQRQFIKSSIESSGVKILAKHWEDPKFAELIIKLFNDFSPIQVTSNSEKIRYMSISTRPPKHHPDAIKLIKRFFSTGTIDLPTNISASEVHSLTASELQLPLIKNKFPMTAKIALDKSKEILNSATSVGSKGSDESVEFRQDPSLDDIFEALVVTKNEFSWAIGKLASQHKYLKSSTSEDFFHGLASTSRTLTEMIAFYMLEISSECFVAFKDKILKECKKDEKENIIKAKTLADLIVINGQKQIISKFWNEDIVDAFIKSFEIFDDKKNARTIKKNFSDLCEEKIISTLHKFVHEPHTIKIMNDSEIAEFSKNFDKRVKTVTKLSGILHLLK